MGMGKKNCRDKFYPGNPLDFNLYLLTQGFSLGNTRRNWRPSYYATFSPKAKAMG